MGGGPRPGRDRFSEKLDARDFECRYQRSIQFRNLLLGKSSDIVSERSLGKANELVAMNCTIVFQPVVDTNRYLR